MPTISISGHSIELTDGQVLLLLLLENDKDTELPCKVRDSCFECVDKGLIVYMEEHNEARLTEYGARVKNSIKDE